MSATAKVVRDILCSASTEHAVRNQVLELANRNLHDPEVVQALVDSVDCGKDFETKREILRFLFTLQPVRFPDLSSFLGKLVAMLAIEKERTFRIELINRLISGMTHDPTVLPVLIDAAVQPLLNDDEAELLVEGLSKMPSLPIEALELLTEQNVNATFTVKSRILRLLKIVPLVTNRMTQALIAWLGSAVDVDSRTKVLRVLLQARKLDNKLNSILIDSLKNESSVEFRLLCLDILNKTQPWDAPTYAQVIATSGVDSSADVRMRAQALLNDQPEINSESRTALAERYFTEANPKVRAVLWERLKLFFRDEAFRNYIIQRVTETSLNALEENDFSDVVDTLFPYFRRSKEVKNSLMELAATSAQAGRRESVINKILPLIDFDSDLDWVAARFRKEPSASVKNKLFARIEPLSVIRFPVLVDVYVDEMLDPSSEFRLKCTAVLAPATESYIEKIVPALEEIILYDTQSELLRSALKGYFLPNVNQRFDVLLSVVKNDSLELSFRRQAVEKIQKQSALTDVERNILDDVLRTLPNLTL